MTQRVNIQYSVKIDELEEEVARLAGKAQAIFERCNTEILSSQVLLSIDAHEQIDQLRLSLAETDAILADVNMIVGSFLSYKSQEMMKSVPQPPAPMEDPPELSDLQEKIAGFKNKLSDIETSSENDADPR